MEALRGSATVNGKSSDLKCPNRRNTSFDKIKVGTTVGVDCERRRHGAVDVDSGEGQSWSLPGNREVKLGVKRCMSAW